MNFNALRAIPLVILQNIALTLDVSPFRLSLWRKRAR